LQMYEDYADLSHEEAEQRGIYNKGDETTDSYYKTRAKEASDTILQLEKEFNNSYRYYNSEEVYNNRVNYLEHKKNREYFKKDIQDIVTKVNSTYENALDLEASNILTGDKIDLRRAKQAFRDTPEYKEIRELKQVYDSFKRGTEVLEE